MPGRFTPCTDHRWQDVAPKMYDVTDAAAINSDHQELMAPWAYNGAAVTLFFIGFFGFFLNIFVIALMYKDVQLWTPMNIILFNLNGQESFKTPPTLEKAWKPARHYQREKLEKALHSL
uniref:Uncharacterized protein n=1 Tax=Anopheles coluzzii TaxID=1518534 RepID=A0A8W7PUK3_ANOCL